VPILLHPDPHNQNESMKPDLYLKVLTLYSSMYRLLWVLMWATVLGLMMQRLTARLGTVITEPCVDCVQVAVGVDLGNCPGSDDATVGGPAGNCHN
jgi:hypothetical protein